MIKTRLLSLEELGPICVLSCFPESSKGIGLHDENIAQVSLAFVGPVACFAAAFAMERHDLLRFQNEPSSRQDLHYLELQLAEVEHRTDAELRCRDLVVRPADSFER